MIHRAPFGSMERFMGILIEHFAGAFPLWLAPEQVRVLTVSEKSEATAAKSRQKLKAAGFRVTGDYRGEKIGAKIREAQLELIPYMLVVGDKDRDAGTVAVRDRLEGDLGTMPARRRHRQAPSTKSPPKPSGRSPPASPSRCRPRKSKRVLAGHIGCS